MTSELIYAVSNSGMDIFPTNSRTQFSNKFPKEISTTHDDNALYLSVENLIMENTIIQYKNKRGLPDIIWKAPNSIKLFKMPERWFNTTQSMEMFLKREFKIISRYFSDSQDDIESKPILDISLKKDFFHLTMLKDVYTLICPQFYKFLGFSSLDNILKVDQHDGNQYYLIGGIRHTGNEPKYRHIVADKKFNINLFSPSMVQIVCKNIIPNLSGGGHNYIIESLSIDYNKRVTNFIPRSTKQYKINTTVLNNVSITLMDEYNLPINFISGVPTIIKLKLFEMSRNLTNFYIKATNTDSKETFRNNVCSSFYTKLPKEIFLNSGWKVGLSNIYLPKNIHNIYEPMNNLFIEEYVSSKTDSPAKVFQAKITPGYYDSSESLKRAINACLFLKIIGIRFHVNERNGRFFIASLRDFYDVSSDTIVKIKFHKKLLGVLGVTNDLLIGDTEDHVFLTFRFYKTVDAFNVMICERFSTVNSLHKDLIKHCFTAQPNLNFSISPWIFLYCTIVKPSITGHSSIPLLKIIPVDTDNHNKGHLIEFNNVEYFPLITDNFQIIHFELRNHDGDLLGMENGQVVLTLSFIEN